LVFPLTILSNDLSDNLILTSSGLVTSDKQNGVLIWQDIPYAQPPIGDLRWKAPRKIKKNSNLIKSKSNNFCLQRTSSFGGSGDYSNESISGNEDCLYLDIIAPSKKSDSLIPVMFWIHGGSNTSGLKDLYNFDKFVRKNNVIVVRINYRLGPLGWFTHPAIQNLQNGLDKTSNFGTLDIIAALEWVNENINLFNGDKNNITVFGESAGAHNVLSLLVIQKANGLFQKAISMSGYTTSISLEDAYKQNTESATSKYSSWAVVERVLSDKKSGKKQDEYTNYDLRNILYGLSGKEFYKYYEDRKTFEEIPLLTRDGVLIPNIGLKKALSIEEYVNKIPMIIGSNRDEVKFWLAFSEYFVTVDSSRGYSFGLPRIVIKDEDAYEAFNYYRSTAWKLRGVDDPLQSLIKAGNKNLYSYRFDWDDQRKFIIADFKKLFGATHALEIPLLIGDNALVGGRPVSNFVYPRGFSKLFISRNMMKFWTNFAKNDHPGHSTNNIKWEPYLNNENDLFNFMILDNRKNLKMSSSKTSLNKLSKELFLDNRLTEKEKCVVLFQMLTYVGDDIYEENIKDYKGKCNRRISEQFIKDNANSVNIEY
tara:strand:+ start:1480 stop:3258 length:1779 start_codon:yes stop_codon:yes gene_type:complete